jgi:predicted GIY-YIG superfamily endonuclease
MDINPETALQKDTDLEKVRGIDEVQVHEVRGIEGIEEVQGEEDIINNTLVCYCIRNETKNRTYVGATNHFTRRIRQHNREIVGGAKATAGHKWHNIILVHGFNTRHDLLSFEWHFKHVVTVNKNGIKRRVEALKKLLSLDRWKMLKVVVSDELKEFL